MNKSTKISLSILGVSVMIGIGAMSTAPHSPYAQELTKLQSQLADLNKEQTKISEDADKNSSKQSTIITNTTLSQTNKKANDLMKNMYSWSSGEKYDANKQSIIKNDITDANIISDFMPNNKDTSGNSQIDALGIKSSFISVKTFAANTSDSDVYLITKASATKSNDDSSSSALSNNYVYKAHYDAQSQKFSSLTFVGKESLTNSTGDSDAD